MFTYLDRGIVIDGISHILNSKYDTSLLQENIQQVLYKRFRYYNEESILLENFQE